MNFDQTDAAKNERQEHLRSSVDAVSRGTPGKGGAERTRIRAPGACYFFFAGTLAAAVFGAIAEDTPTAGEITFLGCFGFLASRLPRIVLFANMFPLICPSRRRQPCRAVWALLVTLSRFLFFKRRVRVFRTRPANSTAANIAYAVVATFLVRDGRSLIPQFSAVQNISFSSALPTRQT